MYSFQQQFKKISVAFRATKSGDRNRTSIQEYESLHHQNTFSSIQGREIILFKQAKAKISMRKA